LNAKSQSRAIANTRSLHLQKLAPALQGLLALLLCTCAAAAQRDEITLPEILAVELPRPQMNQIAPNESSLKG
jgi:hypothetical protein